MCYDEARSALHHFRKSILNSHFRTGIDGRRRFVKDQHGRKRKHNTRNAKKLLLSLRKPTVVTDNGIVTLGQALDEAVRVRSLCRGNDLCLRCIRFTDRDVFSDSRRFDPRILKHHTVRAAQTVSGNITDIRTIHEDLTAVYVIEAHEKSDQRGFAATGRTYDRNTASVGNVYGEITDQGLILRIGEGNVSDVDISVYVAKCLCIFLVGCLRLLFYKLKETLCTHKRVLKLCDDTGNFIKGFCILVGIAEKNGKTADRKYCGICNDGECADKSYACVHDTVNNTGSGIDQGREEYCLQGAFFKFSVHALKGFDRFGFMSVCANDLFIADDLVDISCLLAADLCLCGEKIVRTVRDKACDEK